MEQNIKYASFQNDLTEAFKEDLRDYKKSTEIYRSLCNTSWKKDGEMISYSWRAAGELISDIRNSLDMSPGNQDICQICGKKEKDHIKVTEEITPFFAADKKTFEITSYFCKEDQKTRFTPGYSGKEDYMDFYCSGNEGDVAPWIEERLALYGYSKNTEK